LNFILSCGQVLQKYDIERDRVQREWQAAAMGVEFKDNDGLLSKPPANGRKQTLTQQDMMRNYPK
jgi:hypothetical protein